MRGMLWTLFLLLSASAALPQVALGDERTSSENRLTTPIVPKDWQPLDDRWRAAIEELKIPGVAIVAVKDSDVVLLDAIGVCDPEAKQPVTPRSPFYLASVTKSFTALGVLILVDEGKVKLDEPVKTYLPRFTLADSQKAATVTVRDLLSHRWGLDSSPISLAEAYLGNINDDRYYQLLALVEPRDRFAYSNLHYTLAGRIIEAVTGKSWKDFLAESVFAPLGMRDATCYASQLYANPLAAWPIVERNGAWNRSPLVKNDAVMHAAGGMGASAADMAQWLRFQLSGKTPDGRRLISDKLFDEMQTRQAVYDEPDSGPLGLVEDGYTLGWFTGHLGERRILRHGGGYIGTSTMVVVFPEDKVGMAVLMNESAPNSGFTILVASDIASKLLDLPAVDMLPEARASAARVRERMAARPELAWDAPGEGRGLSQPVERYAGNYENPIFGEALLEAAGGKLAIRIGTLTPRWHALDDDRFRLEITPGDVVNGSFRLDGTTVTAFSIETPMGDMEFSKTK